MAEAILSPPVRIGQRPALDHPTTLALADGLDIDPCFALGIVLATTDYINRHYPDWDLYTLTPSILARGIRYSGAADILWRELRTVGLIACDEGDNGDDWRFNGSDAWEGDDG